MSKKEKFDFDLDSNLIDFLGDDFLFMDKTDEDDEDKSSKKKEKKKKLKKQLKKLNLDTSVLDEKGWKKKAKKLIEEATKEKQKLIKLKKSDYKVMDDDSPKDLVVESLPPYYYDKENDSWVINKAMKISDPEAVIAVKAFAKCRNMHNEAYGKFQIGIPGSKKGLPSKKEETYPGKDRIDNAIEVIDSAIEHIQKETSHKENEESSKEEKKSEALVGEVIGDPKPMKSYKPSKEKKKKERDFKRQLEDNTNSTN